MKHSKKVLGAMSAALFGMVSISGPAQAQPVEEHCVVVTGRTPKDPVRSACSTDPDAPALKSLSAVAIPLMTWYDNWHWDGSSGELTWYGYAGTCDAEGYLIYFDENNFPAWKDRISSFGVHGGCWTTVAFAKAYQPFEGHARYDGDVYYVGDLMNDYIEGFQVTSPR
ncbi:hypothetical protein AB0425_02565 [Actinosynnema sp. NPDC051121]|nr:hypothetical protein [Saccharothrix sp.]